jgi:serine/threonine-protein kinase
MGLADSQDDAGGAGIYVPAKGDLLAGKYRVEAIIGMGGMGMVIAARHEHLDERVAVKTLLPSLAKNEEVRTRFQREARAAFRLQNDNVCRVLDAGELADGSPFLVMEYLNGDDLNTVLNQMGSLPLSDAVDYVIQACSGVAAAHDMGIVHRDIKPSNLVLAARNDGTKAVKVIDFGISKLGNASSVTRTFSYIGSPIYSAPEQLKAARAATAASDIWSMAVVLYQLALGSVPFDYADDTFASVVMAIDAGPIPPSVREPGFPKGLEAVIMRALELDPADRWPSMRAFADALGPWSSAKKPTPAARPEAKQLPRLMAAELVQ